MLMPATTPGMYMSMKVSVKNLHPMPKKPRLTKLAMRVVLRAPDGTRLEVSGVGEPADVQPM